MSFCTCDATALLRRRVTGGVLLAVAAAACGGRPSVATGPGPAAARLASRAQLRSGIDSLLAESMWRNANWGILVVEPASGDTLYSHSAGKLFMPASNEKLLTGSTALAQLGTDYRFSTWFVSSAPIVDGALTGDLVVVGHGDPSMSDAMMGDAMKPLRLVADSLYALGIREIKGSLVKGGNAFPDTTIGEWDWSNLETTSGAAVDELFFNNGVARVTV